MHNTAVMLYHEVYLLMGGAPSDVRVHMTQDLVPPLLALIAASAEVSAARSAPAGSRGLRSQRHSLASLAGIRNAGEGAVRALAWAAGVPCLSSHVGK